MSKEDRTLGSMFGIAVSGGKITDIVGLPVWPGAAIVGEPVAARLALVASALSFGLLANAVLHN
jgi:hypothetical protein